MAVKTLQQQSILLADLLKEVKTEQKLNEVKAQFLGKKSQLNELMKLIPSLLAEEKKTFGEQINSYRQIFSQMIAEKAQEIADEALENQLKANRIDFTLPYRNGMKRGTQHLLTQTMDELLHIMNHLGFKSVSGQEVEDDFHNFTALNVGALHPARQSQDTFYLDNGFLLRTQTSSVQIRYMKSHQPPHYIVSVGKVYRVDDADSTHLPMFHQMECLCIDKDITLIDLKQTIHNMLKIFFVVDDLPIRFRSSYFPFTVPSMEVDIQYNGKWLELMGCGMVHRKVLENVNISGCQGFAFGVGIERLAMVKHNIRDVRNFLENDVRFLKNYG
jgi:phenylalanyl-tRNA synthetase alpha chain